MNSNNNDCDVNDGKNTLSFKDRKQFLEENLKLDSSKVAEGNEWNGTVRLRNPVHRSYTDVQTKTKRRKRFPRTLISWMSEDALEKDAAVPLPKLDLGDHEYSSGDIVEHLIAKLRREKLSSTPHNSMEMVSPESEINDVVDLVKNKPILKPKRRSFRTIFSKDVPHEDPAESEGDGTDWSNIHTGGQLAAGNSPANSLSTVYVSKKSLPASGKSAIRSEVDVLDHTDILSGIIIHTGISETTGQAGAFESAEYISSPIENTVVGGHSNTIYPHSNAVKTAEDVIRPILDELIATEESYVENLSVGIHNYSHIFQRDDLPVELQGREYELFANIADIAKFHRDHLLPMFLENRASADRLFEKLQQLVEDKCFQIYFLFTINKKRSMQLCATHKVYFQHLQTELGDRLGISSFLLQPIQRMARYPLLLTEIIKSLYKHKSCPLLSVCCHLEHKITNLVKTINASECINDIVGIDMTQFFSTFRRFDEFRVYDHTQQRRYLGKLFLFDKTIIATEIAGDKLEFRVQYSSDHLEITESEEDFTLDYRGSGWDDCKCDFSAKLTQVKKWVALIQEIIPQTNEEEQAEGACDEEYYPKNYRRVGQFDVYDHSLARNYRSKIFLFKKCLTFAEVQVNQTLYRGTYPIDQLGVLPFDDYFTLFRHRRNQQECDFRGHPIVVEKWSELLRDLASANLRRAGSFRKKFDNAMNTLRPKTI